MRVWGGWLFCTALATLTNCSASPAVVAAQDGGTDALAEASTDAGCGSPSACASTNEGRTAARLEAVRTDGSALSVFLTAMPKGGDLHNHLSGAVYAETFLNWAQADGLCVSTSSHTLVAKSQCGGTNAPIPDPGNDLYDRVVRAWSMQDFANSAGESGHDHFFATFGKFGLAAGSHRADMIADVVARAAGENQIYVELMAGFTGAAATLGAEVRGGGKPAITVLELPDYYEALIANAKWSGVLASINKYIDDTDKDARTAMGCSGNPVPPACEVTVRYQAQTSRSASAHELFAEWTAAFEVAKTEKRMVGLNLVGPEDGSSALRDYELHMAMLGFLHDKYVATEASPLRIALHAGELSSGVLAAGNQSHLTFHIRRAVEVAHASRIGHGADVLLETDSTGLLAEMAKAGVLAEICLASNDQILELSGAAHPLSDYISAGVPVALATDDQGVARSSLALEHRRAVIDQQLDYRTLKRLARWSLEKSFASGKSLWQSLESMSTVADCQPDGTFWLGDISPPSACKTLLSTSDRARLEWELERRFVAFEQVQ